MLRLILLSSFLWIRENTYKQDSIAKGRNGQSGRDWLREKPYEPKYRDTLACSECELVDSGVEGWPGMQQFVVAVPDATTNATLGQPPIPPPLSLTLSSPTMALTHRQRHRIHSGNSSHLPSGLLLCVLLASQRPFPQQDHDCFI